MMIHRTYCSLAIALGVFLASSTALAQAPTITGITPAPNARSAARTSILQVQLSGPAVVGGNPLRVFSQQLGGLRSGTGANTVASGNTLSFQPTGEVYRPGETVKYTVMAGAASTAAGNSAPWVGQFTAAVPGPGQGALTVGPVVAVGDNSRAVQLADVDNDGDLDLLAVSDFAVGRVAVRLNNGNGTFATAANAQVNPNPYGLAVADVDGDGDLDLLASCKGTSPVVSVRFNNGSGSFGGGQNVTVPGGPQALALGDVDGDGDLDFVCAHNLGAGLVSVRLNNGQGSFSGTGQVSSGNYTSGVALGDLDNDGDLDLVASNLNYNTSAAGTLAIRLNDGTGSFPTVRDQGAGFDNTNVALGDLDGDGDLDIAVAIWDVSGYVGIRLNDGQGGFQTSRGFSASGSPSEVVLGDFDADGDLDLVTASRSSDRLEIWANNGLATFTSRHLQRLTLIGYAYGLAAADLDRDGDLDLAVGRYDDRQGPVRVFFNGGTATGAATARIGAAWTLAPNPSRDGAAILRGLPAGAAVRVLDGLGRLVQERRAGPAGTAELDAGLAPGWYVVQSEATYQRLVVE